MNPLNGEISSARTNSSSTLLTNVRNQYLFQNLTNERLVEMNNRANRNRNKSRICKKIIIAVTISFTSIWLIIFIVLFSIKNHQLNVEHMHLRLAQLETKFQEKRIKDLEKLKERVENDLILKNNEIHTIRADTKVLVDKLLVIVREKDKNMKHLKEELEKSIKKFKESSLEKDSKLKKIQEESERSQKILKIQITKTNIEAKSEKDKLLKKIKDLEARVEQLGNTLRKLKIDRIVNKKNAKGLKSSFLLLSAVLFFIYIQLYYT